MLGNRKALRKKRVGKSFRKRPVQRPWGRRRCRAQDNTGVRR